MVNDQVQFVSFDFLFVDLYVGRTLADAQTGLPAAGFPQVISTKWEDAVEETTSDALPAVITSIVTASAVVSVINKIKSDSTFR